MILLKKLNKVNKNIKHKWEDRNKIFFSSDWHNYHDPKWDIPIWKMRGYNSPQESVDDVVSKINARVKEDDFLWVIGDSFLSATDNQVLNWWNNIMCQNVMVLFGNHESQMYRIYKNAVMDQYGKSDIEVYPLRLNNLTFMGNHQEIQVGKIRIVLNHFPLRTHNQCSRGSWHLHGHSHNNDKTRNPNFQMGKYLDCSWDWKKDIWSFEEIRDIMSTKEIYVTDHVR
jgi:calcineurin-like phosphoesterase family protein